MTYNNLVDTINGIIDGDCNIDIEDLENRIYKAYDDGEITDHEYDHLNGLVQELL